MATGVAIREFLGDPLRDLEKYEVEQIITIILLNYEFYRVEIYNLSFK